MSCFRIITQSLNKMESLAVKSPVAKTSVTGKSEELKLS